MGARILADANPASNRLSLYLRCMSIRAAREKLCCASAPRITMRGYCGGGGRAASRGALMLHGFALALLLAAAAAAPARADTPLHALWELHGKHNTVYLLGSIHVLRPGDYPLAPVLQRAYADAKRLFMEVDLGELDSAEMQSELLRGASLPGGQTLPQVLGPERYQEAQTLAHGIGVELAAFDRFAPWFAAEAISEQQLQALGFQPQFGVEMYFLGRARADGKPIDGLETVHDQLALFEALSMQAQADYLVASLEQARDLPHQVDDMVRAWQRGDTAWFDDELRTESGSDPALYQSVLGARNRKWLPKIEALLNDDRNSLVIVGTAHLVGRDSVLELLKKDGIGATQR
jgi:hypothetical protein